MREREIMLDWNHFENILMISSAGTSETFCHFWQKGIKVMQSRIAELKAGRREVIHRMHLCIYYFTFMPLPLTVTMSKTLRHSFLSFRRESSCVWLKGHIRYSAGDLVWSGGSDFANGYPSWMHSTSTLYVQMFILYVLFFFLW